MSNTKRLHKEIQQIIDGENSTITFTVMIGKHIKINLAKSGRKMLVVWAGTPSDVRGHKNDVARLRRTIRVMEGETDSETYRDCTTAAG